MESPSVEEHVQELLEAGLTALEVGDYTTALARWNAVLAYEPDNSRAAKLVSDLNSVVTRTRDRPTHRSISADVAIVVDSPSQTGAAVESNDASWASASTVEKEALNRLQALLGTSERDHERLRDDLESSRRENLRLRNELAQRERTLVAEREQQLHLEEMLAGQESRIRELERSSRERERELADQKVMMGAQRAEAGALGHELDIARQQLAFMHSEADETEIRLALLTAESSQLRNQLEGAQTVRKTLEEQLRVLQSDLQSTTRTHAATLSHMSAELSQAQEKSAALQKSLDELILSSTTEQQRMHEQLALQTRQMETVKAAHDSAHSLNRELANQIQELNTELERVRGVWIELRRENAEKTEQYVALHERSAELREHYDQLYADYTQQEAALSDADNARRTLETEAVARDAARAAVAERLAAIEDQRDRLLARATTAEAALEVARVEREEARRLQQDADTQIRTLRGKAVALESEVRVLQEAAREVRSLRTLRTELDSKLADASLKLTTLEREVEDARATASHASSVEDFDAQQRPPTGPRRRRTLTRTPDSARSVRATQTSEVPHVGDRATGTPAPLSSTLDNPVMAAPAVREPANDESGLNPAVAPVQPGLASAPVRAAADSSTGSNVPVDTFGTLESDAVGATQRVARVAVTTIGRFAQPGAPSPSAVTEGGDRFSDAQSLDELDGMLGALENNAELELAIASPSDKIQSFILDRTTETTRPGGRGTASPEVNGAAPALANPAVAPTAEQPANAAAADIPAFLDSAEPGSGIELILDEDPVAVPVAIPSTRTTRPSGSHRAVVPPPPPPMARSTRTSGQYAAVRSTGPREAVPAQSEDSILTFTMDSNPGAGSLQTPNLPENGVGHTNRNDSPERAGTAIGVNPFHDSRPPLQAAKPGQSRKKPNVRINDFLQRSPRLAPNAQNNLGSREAFVIGNVDGSTSFADLLDVCGLPPADTARILQSLFEQGVIDFDTEP
jgi:hypothetical protein